MCPEIMWPIILTSWRKVYMNRMVTLRTLRWDNSDSTFMSWIDGFVISAKISSSNVAPSKYRTLIWASKTPHSTWLIICALVNIAENSPPETWTHVYTDGSATKAITDGGAGIIIQYPSGATQSASSATG